MARLLSDDALLAFAIPVLFNICVDYGTAARLLASGHR